MSARQRETQKLLSIEKRCVQILVLFFVASLWFQSWSISVGLILGGGVALLNFRWLWRIMEKVFFEQKYLHGIQVLIKFGALGLVVFFILCYGKVNPIAFIVGIFTLLVGILSEVFREARRENRKGNA